ncbi:MAG: ABC transporter permease subunit [Candidatus Latescibacteria bacterium]|nr:ABC transporter permease subunit [Candidatus Latescibacterota bacterium]
MAFIKLLGTFAAKLLLVTLFVYGVLYFTPGTHLAEQKKLATAGMLDQWAGTSVTGMATGYLDWLGNTIRGELGHFQGDPITRRLLSHTWLTMALVVGALIFSFVLSLLMVLGRIAWPDNAFVGNGISLFNLVSGLHIVVLSYLLVMARWVLPDGDISVWHILILALGNGSLADFYTVLYEQINRALGQNYITAAKGRGASVRNHALRYEITLGLIEATLSRMPVLIGSTIMVEFIFSNFGLGYDIVQAVQERSFELIMGVTTVVAALVIFTTDFTAYMRYKLDPRLIRVIQ